MCHLPSPKFAQFAVSAGFYTHKTNQQKYPKLQLRTVKELMEGKPIHLPFPYRAPRGPRRISVSFQWAHRRRNR